MVLYSDSMRNVKPLALAFQLWRVFTVQSMCVLPIMQCTHMLEKQQRNDYVVKALFADATFLDTAVTNSVMTDGEESLETTTKLPKLGDVYGSCCGQTQSQSYYFSPGPHIKLFLTKERHSDLFSLQIYY